MSKKQQLIKECQELADKGVFNKHFIYDCIKGEFYDLISEYPKRMDLYSKLAKKYDCSISKIRSIISS